MYFPVISMTFLVIAVHFSIIWLLFCLSIYYPHFMEKAGLLRRPVRVQVPEKQIEKGFIGLDSGSDLAALESAALVKLLASV
ncbi:hypothetical protein FTO70_14300 [Methanosarcina sp. KYL-1]|nr:hypothetical protein [Methanosarcina sp. KYL-1]